MKIRVYNIGNTSEVGIIIDEVKQQRIKSKVKYNILAFNSNILECPMVRI